MNSFNPLYNAELRHFAKRCKTAKFMFKSCYPYQLQTAQQCGLFDFYDILTVDKTVTVYRS